jgi:hypothetical protein
LALTDEKFDRLLRKGLRFAKETHSVDDIKRMVADGIMQAVFNESACIITQIVDYPQKRVLDVFMCVGDDLMSVKALKPQLEALAKQHRVDLGRAFVRGGLVRPWMAMGWEKRGVVMFFDMDSDKPDGETPNPVEE